MDDKKGLQRLPQSDDALFAEDKSLYEVDDAVGRYSRATFYKEGYRRAGRILTEHVASHGEADWLVFPICHSYRHFVELALKLLIPLGCRVAKRHMTPAEAKLQREDHSLQKLWCTFVSIEQEVTRGRDNHPPPPEDMHGIEAYIKQLHSVDPGSDSFRYPTSKRGENALEGLGQIDIVRFSEYMERLCIYLDGFHAYFMRLLKADQDMGRAQIHY